VIHPVYRQRPKSGKAGDVTPLDHWIATHGGTTSSYEELPHRIQCYDPSYAPMLVAMLVAMLMTIAGRSPLGYRVVPRPTLFRVSLCSPESYR